MAITWADVLKIAPALSTLSTDTQTLLLSQVAILLNSAAFGEKYDTACIWFAAHLGTLVKAGGQGPAGPITAEAVGRVSRSYATVGISDPALESTHFGQMFKLIVRGLPRRVGFTT